MKKIVQVKFAKVNEQAIIPSKEVEDAGYDVYACFEEDYIEIHPLQTKIVPTGIASALPDTHYFQFQERGSTGTKAMKYGAGVIDSGYRGEWGVPLTNCNQKTLIIAKHPEDFDSEIFTVFPANKAICQAVLIEVPVAKVEEISYEELKNIPSKRGTGKLGSSGK